MTKTTRLLLFLFSIALLNACGLEKKASKAFKRGEYQNVIDLYNKSLIKNPSSPNANVYVAESYRLSNRIHEAEPFYKNALDAGVNNDSLCLGYARALKANEKYTEASQHLQKCMTTITDEKYVKLANHESQNLAKIEGIISKKNYYKVKNLESVNTDAMEYSPIYNDGHLYFTSSRSNKKIYLATGTPFTNIYKAKSKGAKIDISTLESLGEQINNDDINEGSVTFSPDGKFMVFARGNSGKKKGARDVDLYMSVLRNDSWTAPRIIGGSVSKPGSWESCPAFSANGKVLYFASNRPKGHGGTDIYSARMNSRGRFSKVKNLGPKINTVGNEMFPYVSNDGHLYFSSDGHAGFGALDIFVAKRANGKTEIENLGKPVNSNADDFGMFLFKPDRGFFTSNRKGGKGDDDIYTFVNEDPNLKIVNYYLKGVTMTHADNGELEVLPTTKVQLLDYEGNVTEEVTSSKEGKFSFRVYEQEHYTLVGQKTNSRFKYLITREPFTTVGKSVPQEELTQLVTNVSFDTVLVLEKIAKDKIFVLDNIYYDLDKANIRDDAALELDKLVTILEDNVEIKIELSSHTDDRAPDSYNLDLSQRRAKSAVNYLISQGIDKDRLVAKGYGETKLIIQNAKSEEEHQRNRRTEFKILEINENVKPQQPQEGDDDDEGDENQNAEDEFDEDRFFDDDDGSGN